MKHAIAWLRNFLWLQTTVMGKLGFSLYKGERGGDGGEKEGRREEEREKGKREGCEGWREGRREGETK